MAKVLVHVKQFFADRLLRVLGQDPLEASWHVGPKCQLCDYVQYCREHAARCEGALTHGVTLRSVETEVVSARGTGIEGQIPDLHSVKNSVSPSVTPRQSHCRAWGSVSD